MAGQGLLSKIGENVTDSLTSMLTGEPIPGSNEAVRKQIETQTLKNNLKALQQDPNDPQRKQALLDSVRIIQKLNQESQAASNRANLEFMGAPSLLAGNDRLADTEIRKGDAEAKRDLDFLNAKTGHQTAILGNTFGQEIKLADYDANAMDKVLSFYAAAQDKNLAAQKEARQPNFMNVASLLTGLGATAAALFG
jgi:hypothetical protein